MKPQALTVGFGRGTVLTGWLDVIKCVCVCVCVYMHFYLCEDLQSEDMVLASPYFLTNLQRVVYGLTLSNLAGHQLSYDDQLTSGGNS